MSKFISFLSLDLLVTVFIFLTSIHSFAMPSVFSNPSGGGGGGAFPGHPGGLSNNGLGIAAPAPRQSENYGAIQQETEKLRQAVIQYDSQKTDTSNALKASEAALAGVSASLSAEKDKLAAEKDKLKLLKSGAPPTTANPDTDASRFCDLKGEDLKAAVVAMAKKAALDRARAIDPPIVANYIPDAVAVAVGTPAIQFVLGPLCFPAGTPICVNETQSKPIETINVGDFVESCSLTGSSSSCECRLVEHLFENITNHLMRLHFAGQELRTTDNHPFYVVGKNDWVEAQYLRRGDQLKTVSGGTVTLDEIDGIFGEFKVYNLDVQKNHNYYAAGVLVHNCNIGSRILVTSRAFSKFKSLLKKVEARRSASNAGDPVASAEGAAVDKFSRVPRSLQDEMVLDASKEGVPEAKKIIDNLNDPKFKGMEKWEYKVKSAEGKDSVVHYVRDPKTGKLMDFKFKKHSNDQ
jgi:hypothetical protein